MNKPYPSGGNYPETKEDWAEQFIRPLVAATPEQLNVWTQTMIAQGGKFEIMARHMIGEFDLEEAGRRIDRLNQ
jgi:hypothetical protein